MIERRAAQPPRGRAYGVECQQFRGRIAGLQRGAALGFFPLLRAECVQRRGIGVVARGEELYVLEVFFPNDEALQAHKDAVIQALATFEVK